MGLGVGLGETESEFTGRCSGQVGCDQVSLTVLEQIGDVAERIRDPDLQFHAQTVGKPAGQNVLRPARSVAVDEIAAGPIARDHHQSAALADFFETALVGGTLHEWHAQQRPHQQRA